MKPAAAVLNESLIKAFGKDSDVLKNSTFISIRYTLLRSLYSGEIKSWVDVLTLSTALIDGTEWPPKVKTTIKDKMADMVQKISEENIVFYVPVTYKESGEQ